MDAAPVPEPGELPKRQIGERRGRAPDLSSSWWISLDSEEHLAGRLSQVLARAEACVEAERAAGGHDTGGGVDPTPPEATLAPTVSLFASSAGEANAPRPAGEARDVEAGVAEHSAAPDGEGS
jgi:hypothetical protein